MNILYLPCRNARKEAIAWTFSALTLRKTRKYILRRKPIMRIRFLFPNTATPPLIYRAISYGYTPVSGVYNMSFRAPAVSFATKSAGLEEYIKTCDDATDEMKSARFAQGDIITTVLTCAQGETILLRLDTTLPRSYSRDFTVRGTKGMYMQDTNSVYLDGDQEFFEPIRYYEKALNNAVKFENDYLPDIWKNVTPEAENAGHGGMDWFAYKGFTDALKNKTEMPIDVYDAAVWQAVSVLSEISIKQGGAPQAMPDFTNGKWIKRLRKDVCEL